MLTPGSGVTISRRALIGGMLALSGAACARVPLRAAEPPTPGATPELDAWRAEAGSMLADALQTLRTFEIFSAYRVSVTTVSDRRLPNELIWDAPTGVEWDAATHVARSLRARADQLLQAISVTQVDASVWREQRALADVAHDIGPVGDALGAYRDRLDQLKPGDAAAALSLLDEAWGKWEHTASAIGLGRAEAIACGTLV
jgi:hypothetical protein